MRMYRKVNAGSCNVCEMVKTDVYYDIDTVTGVICWDCIVEHDVTYPLHVLTRVRE